MTDLSSEPTNRYAACTITPFAPELVAEFPYKDLAWELNEPRLADINDSFKISSRKVWGAFGQTSRMMQALVWPAPHCASFTCP